MLFEDVLPYLKKGEVIRRVSFPKKFVIFMQIEADISAELAMGLKSVPKNMKLLLLDADKGITYNHQTIVYDFSTMRATNYTFSSNDINADDWEIIDITEHYNYD